MKNKKILIVDDEFSVLEFLSNFLSGKGYNITRSDNAKKALDILKLNKFDLILTDIDMPEVSGIELVKYLVSRKNKTPIIMMSANINNHEHDVGIFLDKRSIRCFIGKPFEFDFLLSKVEEHILWIIN